MSIPIHRRSYDCEAFAEGDDRIRVRGHLNDTKPLGLGIADGEPLVIHDMTIELVVRVPEFVIVAVDSEMGVHPYQVCPAVLGDYDQLVGLSITRGYSRRVRELFGGPNGCAHMGALLQALGPVAVQASWSLSNLHGDLTDRAATDTESDDRERRIRLNTNTCHVWAEDGDHVRAVAAGEVPGRPAWEEGRLRQLGLLGDEA